MRPSHVYAVLLSLVLLLVIGCGSGDSGSAGADEKSQVRLRPDLQEIMMAVKAATDTYDIEDIMDDLNRYSRREMNRLGEDGWRANLDDIETFPAEIMVVADSVVARWHQVGVVRDGINHRDDLQEFEEMRDEMPWEGLRMFADFMDEELESEDPDLRLLNRLAHICEPYYDQLSPRRKSSWLSDYGKTPSEMASIFSDRPTFEAFLEEW